MIGRTIRTITEATAKRNKQLFLSNFNPNWLNEVKHETNLNVVSFSGTKQFADQLYSVASFFRNVGKPNTWVIYNDGTYTQHELKVFCSIPSVQVREIDNKEVVLPLACFEQFPTLLKVELLRQLTDFSRTTLFADSDILFYQKFKKYISQFANENWYIVDEGKGYFDPSFKLSPNEHPLNFGFLVLNEPSNWNFVFKYIMDKIEHGELHYWSDQTAVHILAQREQYKVMPTDHFVVDGTDSFKLFHAFDYNKIALRHFVGPVRHKMWQYPWKKVLGI